MTDPQLKEDPKLAEIVRRLVTAFEPERIYLFGSKARGDEDLDSDYDVMVVAPDEAPDERKDSGRAYEVLRGTGVATDVVVYTSKDFEERLHVVCSLPATVKREGRLLYAV